MRSLPTERLTAAERRVDQGREVKMGVSTADYMLRMTRAQVAAKQSLRAISFSAAGLASPPVPLWRTVACVLLIEALLAVIGFEVHLLQTVGH